MNSTNALDYIGLSSPTALQGFLEAAPDAIIVVDSSGRIVIANALAERMFRYSREELVESALLNGMPVASGLVWRMHQNE